MNDGENLTRDLFVLTLILLFVFATLFVIRLAITPPKTRFDSTTAPMGP
ncbi:MAG: hypothetical protein IT438_13795 [Phycisphaerales bacterium]|nr:hypothetical protein [Phycisphaerales bacterium]